jgi:hypothetical protein
VAKDEWHPGELYPRVGFIVTNLARSAEGVVAFYNHRGTCEQYIEEGQGRGQVDPPVMPILRRQRGAPSAPCSRLQPRQLRPVSRQMFQDILLLIARLRAPPLRHDRAIASDATNDGTGVPRCRRSNTFRRVAAVNWQLRPPDAHAARDLPLLKTPERAILASQLPGGGVKTLRGWSEPFRWPKVQ